MRWVVSQLKHRGLFRAPGPKPLEADLQCPVVLSGGDLVTFNPWEGAGKVVFLDLFFVYCVFCLLKLPHND